MKKIITSIMITLVSILCMAGYAYAANQLEATVKITPDITEVKPGDKVTLTFTTVDIKNAEYNKIYAIDGVIEYNKNFFAYDSGMEIGETGKFNSMTVVTEGGENGKIVLKVIDNPTGEGTIRFSALSAGDGRLEDSETLGVAKTPDQTITIKLKTEETLPPEGDDEGEEVPPAGDDEGEEVPPTEGEGEGQVPPAGETEGDKNEKPTTEGTTVVVGGDKDNTTADKEIPKAGLSKLLTIGVAMILVIAVVIYRKKQKYQDIK